MNFRKFKTSSGKLVLGGKNAENNEELLKQVKDKELVLHTEKPGSPFVNIKLEKGKRVTEKDIYESALFCAVYSQDWKHNHNNVVVNIFKGENIFKERKMKLGTFGVKKNKKIAVKKKDIENLEKEIKR